MSMRAGPGRSRRRLQQGSRGHGGEIRTEAEVARIQVDTYTCKGVVLAKR